MATRRTWDEMLAFAQEIEAKEGQEADDDYQQIEAKILDLESEIAYHEEEISSCELQLDGLHSRKAEIEQSWRDGIAEPPGPTPRQLDVLEQLKSEKPRTFEDWVRANQMYQRAGVR